MSRLLIHVEGQTEETFVNEVLSVHLYSLGYTKVSARLIGNSRQRARRGGTRAWSSVREEIVNHLRQDSGSIASTMVDFYALPQNSEDNWPGRARASKVSVTMKAPTVENALHLDVCSLMGTGFEQSRFVPYVVMHEFEGLLFSNPARFASGIGRTDLEQPFQNIRNLFASPEEINDSPNTAPSKRVESLMPNYEKPLFGSLAAIEIGLQSIRRECPLFNNWLERLEALVQKP